MWRSFEQLKNLDASAGQLQSGTDAQMDIFLVLGTAVHPWVTQVGKADAQIAKNVLGARLIMHLSGLDCPQTKCHSQFLKTKLKKGTFWDLPDK